MSDLWLTITEVGGALLILAGVQVKLVRPMLRAIWRTIKRLNKMADDLEGDKQAGTKSLREEVVVLHDAVTELGVKLQEHLDWHAVGGRDNGPRPATRPSGRPAAR